MDIPAGAFVIPGAEVVPGQKISAEIFSRKNAQGINAASEKNRELSKQPKEGGKQTYAAVDGEHPQGGVSLKLHVPLAQGAQSSEQYFKAPAKEPALKEGFYHSFYHSRSMG